MKHIILGGSKDGEWAEQVPGAWDLRIPLYQPVQFQRYETDPVAPVGPYDIEMYRLGKAALPHLGREVYVFYHEGKVSQDVLLETHFLKSIEPREKDPTPPKPDPRGLTINVNGRVLSWDLNQDQLAVLLSAVVQTLGPGQEVEGN